LETPRRRALTLEPLEPRILLSAIPIVTDPAIAAVISTDNGTTGVADVGDVVTLTWDNSATGDSNADIASVAADLSQFGGPSSAAMADDGAGGDATASDGIWTLQYTIAPGNLANHTANATVTATNGDDESGSATDTSNIVVTSLVPPTVTDAAIQAVISTDGGAAGVANIGDAITVTWNNSLTGDNNPGITTVRADLSQFGGPASAAMVDNGTGGDVAAGDGIYTVRYTIQAGSISSQTANVTVTATNAASQSTATADTSNITVDNGALTRFTSGNTVVSVYDPAGAGNVAAGDIQVTFTKSDAVKKIALVGMDSLEGLGLVISGAPKVGQIVDQRAGDRGDLAFIASDSAIGAAQLKGAIAGYNLNGLTLGGVTFAADIDGDGNTSDLTGFYTTTRAGTLGLIGDLSGDVWLGGEGVKGRALGALHVHNGDLASDVSIEGRAGNVKVRGGDFSGNLDVAGKLHKLVIAKHGGAGGKLVAGSDVAITGKLGWARISSYDTANGSVAFGLTASAINGVNLGGKLFYSAALPFASGDFRVRLSA
jgi:hypothetical protein